MTRTDAARRSSLLSPAYQLAPASRNSYRGDKPILPSVLIADDYRLYAEALSSMLSSEFRTIAIASDGRQLTEMAEQFDPDLIVTDISMPLLSGLEAIRVLATKGLHSKVIVLTMHAELALAVEAFRSGASAFVLKTAGAGEFRRAVQVVLGGGYHLSSQLPWDLVTVLAQAARANSASGWQAPRL